MRFGMMQGRLLPSKDGRLQSFPVARWREEFQRAAQARIDCLEWLYDDLDASGNPLSYPAGVADIRAAVRDSGVPVASICAHWFVEHPLLGAPASAALDKLRWLGDQAQEIGAGRIVVPLEAPPDLEPSRRRAAVLEWVARLAPLAEPGRPVLALEYACELPELRGLVAAMASTGLMLNYDIGNSAGLGLNVGGELDLIGDRLGSVHLKDKSRGGASVPLGLGAADFAALGHGLRRHGFDGDLILEAARGPVGEEIPWTLGYRALLDRFLGGGPGR